VTIHNASQPKQKTTGTDLAAQITPSDWLEE